MPKIIYHFIVFLLQGSILQSLHTLQQNLNYTFQNKKLLDEALTHKSYNRQCNNERLEFLGDAVLDLAVAEFLFFKLKHRDEGVLSKMRASLVNEKSFCKLANNINLGPCLHLSYSEENNGGRSKSSILSNAFEAIMAVIYLESGLDSVKKIFYPLIESEFNISEDSLLKDYKSQLQELTQERFGCIPIYKILSEEGPDHNKSFVIEVYIKDKPYGVADGNSKKRAQQEAAKLTLEALRNCL